MSRLLHLAAIAVAFVPVAEAAIPAPRVLWHGLSFDGAYTASPVHQAREDFDRMIEIAPAKGRPVIGSVAIDWCTHANTENGSGGALARAIAGMEERGWFWEDITRVASYLCVNPRDAKYQRQAGYFIQGLVNLTGQTAAEVLADLRFRMDGARWAAERDATCKRYQPSGEASVEERELAEAHRDMFGCSYDGVPGWWLDRANTNIDHHLDRTAAEPSQLLRSYSVTRCMALISKPEQVLLRYAMCSRDLHALDAAVLDRELAADKHNAFARTIARQQLSRTKMRAADFEAKVRALAAKDAAFEQLAFKVPSAAWDRAIARYRSNAATLARAAAFEAVFYGPSKKAARGCSTQLREDFRSYVRAAKPKDLAAVDAAATDDVGVLLLSRLSACEALDGSGHAAVMLHSLGNAARTARGPRLAVYHALVDALSEIRADRERFPLEPRDLPSMPAMELWNDAYRLASTSVLATQKSAGVVKKTTAVDDGVIVEFATESWTEDDWSCADTNKIFKIDDGRIIYHQSCKKVGKRTVKRTAPPVWIPSAYAAKVTAGAFVELEYDVNRNHDKAIAMPRVVFKDKQRTTLLAAYGIALYRQESSMTANNLREYQHLLATAERVDWRLDDVLAPDATFDFTRPFLPEALACTAPLAFLDTRERLVLNHVRAAAYLGLFGVIEEMILPFLVEHVRKTTLDSLTTVRALLQFASEETKHIALFRRFRETFERGFGHPCGLVGPAADFAAAVLQHPPLSVALAILHIEWMTQRHWTDAVHDDSSLEPAFVRLLRYHWMEEAQHARLDDLIAREIAASLDETAISRAFEGYASIIEILDGALGEQMSLDLVSFQNATGRLLDDSQHTAYRIVSRKAQRAGFLLAGMTHPQFIATVQSIDPTAPERIAALARSYR